MSLRALVSVFLSIALALPALAHAQVRRKFEDLAKAFSSASVDDRVWAAETFGKQREEGAAELLGRALGSDAAAAVRNKAAWALGTMGAAAAGAALERAVTSDQDAGVRFMAAWALGRLGKAASSSALARALQDGDTAVRAQAARSLGEVGDRAAVGALRGVLGDKADQVRVAAIGSLRKLGLSDGEIRAALPASMQSRAIVAEKKSQGLGLALGLVGAGLIYADKPALGWSVLAVELAGVALAVVGAVKGGLDSEQVCPDPTKTPGVGGGCSPDIPVTQSKNPGMNKLFWSGVVLAAGAWLTSVIGTPLAITRYNQRIDEAKSAFRIEPFFDLRADQKVFGAQFRF